MAIVFDKFTGVGNFCKVQKMKGILFLVFIFLFTGSAFAFDWKSIHEAADKTTLNEALIQSETKPDSIEGLYLLGLVYLNLHKDLQAKEAFDTIIKLDPEIYEARWGIAEVLRRQHKLDEAEVISANLIKEHPDFSSPYLTLGYIKYLKFKFEDAVILALKVMKQPRARVDLSNYVRSYAMYAGCKGMIAHYGGPLSKAINGTAVLPNLKKAESMKPDSPAVLFGLGSFYFLAPSIAGGDINKALFYLNKAIEADPLFADAYVRLAQLYKLKKDKKNFETYLNKALDIDPGNELALDTKSGACKFLCKPD